jgi:hypothetical protein
MNETGPSESAPDPRVPPWARRAVFVAAIVWAVGLGVSTVYRAGPYPLAASGSGPKKLGPWEKCLGVGLDQSGARTWGSKAHRTDFTVWTTVGQAMLDGRDIYKVDSPRHWKLNNAPLSGIAFVPFALLPLWLAMILWYLLSLAAVAIGVKCSVEMAQAGGAAREKLWLYALPLLLLAWPLMSGLARGQTTPFFFGFVMAGVYLAWKGRDAWAGTCLMGAILLKMFPAALLLYYAWRRRWRLVASTLVAVAAGTFVVPSLVYGWGKNWQYQREWFVVLQQPEKDPENVNDPRFGELNSPMLVRNQSLSAVAARLTGNVQARWVGTALAAGLLAVMGGVAYRARADDALLLLAAMLAWMLLASPVSWAHYFIALILPLALLTRVAMEDGDRAKRQLARTVLVVFAVLGTMGASRTLQVYGPLCWGTLALWGGLLLCVRGSRTESQTSATLSQNLFCL